MSSESEPITPKRRKDGKYVAFNGDTFLNDKYHSYDDFPAKIRKEKTKIELHWYKDGEYFRQDSEEPFLIIHYFDKDCLRLNYKNRKDGLTYLTLFRTDSDLYTVEANFDYNQKTRIWRFRGFINGNKGFPDDGFYNQRVIVEDGKEILQPLASSELKIYEFIDLVRQVRQKYMEYLMP